MKNLKLNVWGAAILVSFLFTGCSKDEETSTKTNSFSYNSKSYDTPKGLLDYYGPEDDNKSGSFDLVLLSSGLSFDMAEISLVGKGDYAYVELQSPSLTELVSGTYTFDYGTENGALKPNTFGDAAIELNFDGSNYTGNEYNVGSTSTGTVIVNKSGTTYEITYNFTVDGGKKVEGYYKGALQFSDETGTKKSAQIHRKNIFKIQK